MENAIGMGRMIMENVPLICGGVALVGVALIGLAHRVLGPKRMENHGWKFRQK